MCGEWMSYITNQINSRLSVTKQHSGPTGPLMFIWRKKITQHDCICHKVLWIYIGEKKRLMLEASGASNLKKKKLKTFSEKQTKFITQGP